MKKIILFSFVICSLLGPSGLFVKTSYSQNLNFFAQIIGTWESPDAGEKGSQNKETWDIHWTLNKYFIEIDIHGDSPNDTYADKYLFTIDENNNIIGWAFDARPGINFMNFTANNIDDKISVAGIGKVSTYKFTLQLKEGKLYREDISTYRGDVIKGSTVFNLKQ